MVQVKRGRPRKNKTNKVNNNDAKNKTNKVNNIEIITNISNVKAIEEDNTNDDLLNKIDVDDNEMDNETEMNNDNEMDNETEMNNDKGNETEMNNDNEMDNETEMDNGSLNEIDVEEIKDSDNDKDNDKDSLNEIDVEEINDSDNETELNNDNDKGSDNEETTDEQLLENILNNATMEILDGISKEQDESELEDVDDEKLQNTIMEIIQQKTQLNENNKDVQQIYKLNYPHLSKSIYLLFFWLLGLPLFLFLFACYSFYSTPTRFSFLGMFLMCNLYMYGLMSLSYMLFFTSVLYLSFNYEMFTPTIKTIYELLNVKMNGKLNNYSDQFTLCCTTNISKFNHYNEILFKHKTVLTLVRIYNIIYKKAIQFKLYKLLECLEYVLNFIIKSISSINQKLKNYLIPNKGNLNNNEQQKKSTINNKIRSSKEDKLSELLSRSDPDPFNMTMDEKEIANTVAMEMFKGMMGVQPSFNINSSQRQQLNPEDLKNNLSGLMKALEETKKLSDSLNNNRRVI